jgi:hypothetical protein
MKATPSNNRMMDVDDLPPPPFEDPIGPWPISDCAATVSRLINGQSRISDIEVPTWREMESVEDEIPSPVLPTEEQDSPLAAAGAEQEVSPLLKEFVYLGKNCWLRRDGPTWATAAEELDTAVMAAVADSGYQNSDVCSGNRTVGGKPDPILMRASEQSTLSERGFVLQHMKRHLHVHEVWNAANWPHGVFTHHGRRILNRAAYKLVEPVGEIMPECWRVYSSGLLLDQRDRVLGLWRETLKRAHAGGLAKGWFQPAGLGLASDEGGVGKSRLIYYLAVSSGAECPASAGGYLAGDILGCSHLLQQPVVELSDVSVPDREVPQAQTRLLNLISSPVKEIRLMRTEVKLVPLSPLLCVSLNSDNPECMKIWRDLPVTVLEKWIIVVCGNGTRALREGGFDYSDLERTLPQMVGYLLSSDTPDEYLHEVVQGRRQRARFLVGHYFDPTLNLQRGPVGGQAAVWQELQQAVRQDRNPPRNGRYKVSQLRTLVIGLRGPSAAACRKMSDKAFGVTLAKLQAAIPDSLVKTPVGNPKRGGWNEYSIV